MVLIMGIILVAAGVAVAVDAPKAPRPLGPPVTLELLDGVAYTGIIKNNTRYEVSIPSENSDATLVIPPHKWIEYTIWTHKADVTAYHNGTPFYCLKLDANPQAFPFMCKNYDFMAEIVKADGGGGKYYKPMKKRKYRVKKRSQA
jgi:hypothetical protein